MAQPDPLPTCDLCGEPGITVTECCENWICSCELRGSCIWHHDRYSSCANHYKQDHDGPLEECEECESFGGQAEIDESEKYQQSQIRCGLCKAPPCITITECCNNLLCDDPYLDEEFRSSCHWGHQKFSKCARHFKLGHGGSWRNCERCTGGKPSTIGKYEIVRNNDKENMLMTKQIFLNVGK